MWVAKQTQCVKFTGQLAIMQKYYHLQAFELLTVLCSSDTKECHPARTTLHKLAGLLDGYFGSSDFDCIFTKSGKLSAEGNLHDEDLFINYDELPLEYTNQEILNLRDRVLIYACMLAWIKKFALTNELAALAKRVLSVNDELSVSLAGFISDEDNVGELRHNGVLYLEPKKKSDDSLDGNWVKSNQPWELEDRAQHYVEGLPYPVKVLIIYSLKLFMVRCQDDQVQIGKDGQQSLCSWEYCEPGDAIELDGESWFDYYDLKRMYLATRDFENLVLKAEDISYTHIPGKGVKNLDLIIDSGTLLGILGKEGSGKSTILNLLAGEFRSATGDISINAYSYRKELFHLKGMIGYVPEDDLLFDELSVFDNLYCSARLYLGNLSKMEIRKKVKELLIDLDLWSVAHKVVGPYHFKNLQPGQRRLLNIALELVRDPQILIVDNSTAPLSLSDSSKIVEILSAYTFKGRIVITSITQTENRLFQYFDKLLLLDEGGVPLITGKISEIWKALIDAVGPVKDPVYHPGANEILDLLDLPVFEAGTGMPERYKSSDELFELLRKGNKQREGPKDSVRKILPKNILQPPTLDRQYMIFNLRNFKTKLSQTRELLATLLSAPLLAFLLAIVFRQGSKTGYHFHDNDNIPVFFFISFLVSLFLGLVLSAREVFRERQVIQKQTYLNISKFSYINSKITYLFILAFFQSILFILISHSLLQIRGMWKIHWLIYFSCQSFGLLTGLVLSESHRTLDNIYTRTIPVILILQLLFGGGLVNPDSLSNQKRYTPLIADLMVTRWAHEAMMVYQFRNNEYGEYFYSFDRDYSSGRLNTFYHLPLLRENLGYCLKNYREHPDSIERYLNTIKWKLQRLPSYFDIFPYENIDSLNRQDFNQGIADDLGDYLEYIDLHFYSLYETALESRKKFEEELTDSLGEDQMFDLFAKHTNRAVTEKVTNKSSGNILETSVWPPVQVADPIYQYPESDFGRAKFFVPSKSINGQLIDTIEFDISIIWLFNLTLYILLLTNLFSREKVRKYK